VGSATRAEFVQLKPIRVVPSIFFSVISPLPALRAS
jgi:hypothetical protein